MRGLRLGFGRGRKDEDDEGGEVVPPGPTIPEFGVSSNGNVGNYYIRTASLPNKFPLTIRVVAKMEVNRANYSGVAALNKTGDELLYFGTTDNGETLAAYAGVNFEPGTVILPVGSWHHLTMTYDGNIVKHYYDGVLGFTSSPIAQAADAAVSFTLLTTDFGSAFFGAIQAAAVWESVLTAEQIADDVAHLAPEVTDGLWAWWLLDGVNDVTDRSGNGRNLTKVGTPVAVAGSGAEL